MSLFYKKFIRPLFFNLDAESAHELVCRNLARLEKSCLAKRLICNALSSGNSPVDLFGLSFPNQLGLAAGLDKDGRFPGISSALGFGHIEVGTVTPKPQPGNDKPRLFRYPKDEALINRMGFNNDGAKKLCERLKATYPKGKRSSPLGVNIGKGKETPIDEASSDYNSAFDSVAEQADYITVNVSSPNTPELRKLQDKDHLESLLKAICTRRNYWCKINQSKALPLLLKLSPDESFSSIERIIGSARDLGFDGVIATNTSIGRDNLSDPGTHEAGGLSGKPIEKRSIEVIRFISNLTNSRFPIIGAGGIHDTDSAIRKLDAGASLLQIYTSFIYEGPLFPSTLAKSLSHRKSFF